MTEGSEYIIYGGPVSADYTKEFQSLGSLILKRLTDHGDKIAIIDGKTDREITYSDIKVGALKLAEYFRRLGIKKGDVIGLASENRIEYPFVVFGAFFVGATITSINSIYTEDEIVHAFNLSKPKIIFGAPTAILKLQNVSRRCSFIPQLLQFGEVPVINGITLLNTILKDPSLQINPNFQLPSANVFEDAVLILLSSGTTGLPKGVQLTHANLMASLANSEENRGYLQEEGVVLLNIVPWLHVYGMLTLVNMTCLKVKLVMLPKFEDELYLRCIEKYKVTHCGMVPPLVVFMAKSPLVDKYNMSSLKELYCGAAPLSGEVEESVMKRIPNVKAIRQGYGMSESTAGVIGTVDGLMKLGSVGVVGQGIHCKVVDPETGRILGPYEKGELCFKGRVIMKGYIGNDEATKEMIRDGWLHTGDVGYYDNDKHFFIVDRLKELIKYNAFQVAPAELEAIILTHPKVQDVAVIGKPDANNGELPMAFIVKQANMDVTEKEIVDFVAEKVAPYKKLRGGVVFIDQIPKNASGKILRKDLRAMLMQPKSKL